ncbi:MAG: ATP-binding protein [Myxococcota bacterium]
MEAEAAAVPGRRQQGAYEGFARRLVILMGARLALSLVSLCIALALEAAGGELNIVERRGFYWTVTFAFLATVVYGLALPRVRRVKQFAAVNIATDIVIVSALVHFSGAEQSVFSFLYVLVAVYGGVLFERRGAVISACLGALAYGALLLAGHQGWVPRHEIAPLEARPLLLSVWVIHAAAVVLGASLASYLAVELRRTGEALEERTSDLARLQSLHQRTVESLMSGLLTTNTSGCITSFNPEAERITGVPAAEAIGRGVDAVLPGIQELLARPEDRGRGGQARARMPYRSRRGEDLHIGVAVSVLRDAAAGASGDVVIFQDVTQVVDMENDLRRSERLAAVGQLSASIAHEIRNPLAAISGSIQVLREKLGPTRVVPDAGQLMDIVLRETEHLNGLITDFLQYARPAPRRLEVVVVEELVNDVLKMFEAARPDAVEVAVAIEPALSVAADGAQLRQVLWNLVLNAAQAMPDGGRLEIRAGGLEDPAQEHPSGRRNGPTVGEKARWAEIVVVDQGVGVPPEAMDRIFDPFFTTKRGGSGLGLAIVHRIVDDHGGSVRLESGAGEGTRVRVRLPRAEAAG